MTKLLPSHRSNPSSGRRSPLLLAIALALGVAPGVTWSQQTTLTVAPQDLPGQVVSGLGGANVQLTTTLAPSPGYPFTVGFNVDASGNPSGPTQLTTNIGAGTAPVALSTQAILINGNGAQVFGKDAYTTVTPGPALVVSVPGSAGGTLLTTNFANTDNRLYTGVIAATSTGGSLGNGGSVSVEYGAGMKVQAASAGQIGGASLSALWAQSVGGGTNYQGPWGSGGAVSVHTQAGSLIELNVSDAGSQPASFIGINAQSAGFWNPYYSHAGQATEYPALGGNVSVIHDGVIQGSATGLSSSTTAIVAQSFGGSAAVTLNPFYGGNVAVTVNGSIALAGPNTVGVLAVSGLDESVPVNSVSQYGPPGAVTVNVGSAGSINTGVGSEAVGAFSFGIQAANISGPSNLYGGSGRSALAGPVTVANAGSITTAGPLAVGIAAMSLPVAVVGWGSPSGANYLGSASASMGGGGSGIVTVTNTGTIATHGNSAFGVLAISGAGGLMNIVTGSDATNYTVIGNQDSGAGSSGGQVSVTNSGSIVTGGTATSGIAAMGIVAQSIGGGGGSAGGAHGWFVGDAGGAGGNGGTVSVATTGSGVVTTTGVGAHGIAAESIGGGGGSGASITGIAVATGGKGGAGGSGGQVTVNLADSSQVNTAGHFAYGVLAQSIGGGGGNGGFAQALGTVATISHGGKGGSGGGGGEVDFTNAASVVTAGDRAMGVALQSIGGGGGSGGSAISRGVSIVTVNLSLGGSGGAGGYGGTINATNTGSITTSGNDSIGVLAQSVGGGGGDGGTALTQSLAVPIEDIPAIAVSVAIGGNGATGGGGGKLQFGNSGTVSTQGDGAHGILAQSIGGGGGSGGDSAAVARSFTGGEGGSVNVAFALGGAGGAGSNGGSVVVDNRTGTIWTSGNLATGILAQSIGGGGGNGAVGFAKTAGTPLPTTGSVALGTAAGGGEHGEDEGEAKSYSLAIGIGGGAGSGGNGGSVSVTNTFGSTQYSGSITTYGSGSYGILGQSIGGGGGNGGGGGTTGGTEISANISVGGKGGNGGDGGSVTITNDGLIATGNLIASGGLKVTIGGDAAGILAQSIGGGGGIGGSSDAVAPIAANNLLDDLSKAFEIMQSYQKEPAASYTARIGVGGSGGKGGNGGQVTVTNGPEANITTAGARAHGIFAQSIGAAGGIGGSATSSPGVDLEVEPEGNNTKYTTRINVGGSPGGNGSGGAVTVANSGTIRTSGYGAVGALLQSIGGGGGYAADGTPANNVTTFVGGDANSGPSSLPGNNGGAVKFTDNWINAASIATAGDDAPAVVAQSIGGGGGIASAGCTNTADDYSWSLRATPCYGNNAMSGLYVNAWRDGSLYSAQIGGYAYNWLQGLGINSGGPVTLTENGYVVTFGARSMGLVAQSIGGGGGLQTMAAGNIHSATLAVYGPPSAQANQVGYPAAGPVDITLTGAVETHGAGAWGILAQSLGGGGGFVGDPALPLAVIARPPTISYTSAQEALPTNNITVASSGSITTSGANAHGIVAQSIGGGGGAWVTLGSDGKPANLALGSVAIPGAIPSFDALGGNVTIAQTAGTISASGVGSIGILAQSVGAIYNWAHDPSIAVTIGGKVAGGSNGGTPTKYVGAGAAGIVVAGGSLDKSQPNLITIQKGGSVTTQDGANGTAIVANTYANGITDGYTDVVNNGTITGSVITTGTVTNNGTINSGTQLASGNLVNHGTLSAWGLGTIGSTQHVGSLTHAANGVMLVNVDALATQKQDQITVSGDVAFHGVVAPVAMNLLPGAYPYLAVAPGSGSLQHAGRIQQGVVFGWQHSIANGVASLVPQPDFRPAAMALDPAQAALTGYLGATWQRADTGLAGTFAYLSQLPSTSSYSGWLQNAAGATLATPSQIMLQAAGRTLDSVMGCEEFVGAGTTLGEGSCVWASAGAGKARQDGSAGNAGYDGNDFTIRLGGQWQLAPSWFLAGSFGYSDVAATASGFTSSMDAYALAAALQYAAGPWQLTGALSYSYGSPDNQRLIDVSAAGTFAAERSTATSAPRQSLLGARLRAAYELPLGPLYARPYADVDVLYNRVGAYSESGSALALKLPASSQTQFVFSPMLQFGGRYDLAGGGILRPYVDVGASFRTNNTVTANASFAVAAGSETFPITATMPRTLGKVEAGLQLYGSDKIELKALYGAQFGGGYTAQGGSLKLLTRF